MTPNRVNANSDEIHLLIHNTQDYKHRILLQIHINHTINFSLSFPWPYLSYNFFPWVFQVLPEFPNLDTRPSLLFSVGASSVARAGLHHSCQTNHFNIFDWQLQNYLPITTIGQFLLFSKHSEKQWCLKFILKIVWTTCHAFMIIISS